MTSEEDLYLMHYGIKGMKWGRRKDGSSGTSRRTERDAKKDASEFARAKMYYGEGAGTRRKLIKATVESKSKKDPSYKEAFDRNLGAQDFSKHATKARSQRKRTDTKNSVAKTARGVHRLNTGGFGNTTIAAAAVVGAYGFARSKGYDKVVINAGRVAYSTVKNEVRIQNLKKNLKW